MFSKLFESISYPLVAFVFFMFIAIIYLINKKYNSYSNKTYRALLFFAFGASIALFLFMFAVDGISFFKGLEKVFARIYILLFVLWASSYMFYLIITLLLKNTEKKSIITTMIIVYAVNIGLFIWSCFLEVEYEQGNIYTICGDVLTPLYVQFALVGLIYFLSLIIGRKKMTKTQMVMHTMILIILMAITALRFLANWEVNYFTYFVCLIPIALYYSSESSAYVKSIELKKSRIEYEESNKKQNEIISTLSSSLINPLDKIQYSTQRLNEEVLSDEEFKNEKIKIYNETKKIYDLIMATSRSESEVQSND